MSTANALHLDSRMPVIASIRASALAPIIQELDKRTAKTDVLLAGHGILRAQLNDPYAVVPIARYLAAFEEAAVVVRDPFLGAELGVSIKPADLGPMGMLFSMTSTIEAAFKRLCRSMAALQGASHSSVSCEDETLIWSYGITDTSLSPRRQDSEFTLATTCHLVRQCFSSSWRPLEVHFEHGAPRDPKPLERIFQAPVLFGQSTNRLVMDLAGARRVYRKEDPALASVLERHINDLFVETVAPTTYSERVLALIAIHLGFTNITLATISRELGIPPRTLQRRLADEGTSIRKLVQDYRKSLLRRHNAAPGGNRSRLAQALGYADSTALWRAEKRWEDGE
ncbi:AraC family transcriptional regulator ligand-binding domain-containing protein [Afifella sp. YEN Y35]|uniref:AraC family transcriptional regulator n=1 Tax=Afifella sp. YEN Y35 TaxID=3388337 RepID=UPI0039E04147